MTVFDRDVSHTCLNIVGLAPLFDTLKTLKMRHGANNEMAHCAVFKGSFYGFVKCK